MAGQWPRGSKLLWYLDPSGLEFADVAAALPAIQAGIESWNQVCDVHFERTRYASQARLVVRFVADLRDDPHVPYNYDQISAWWSGSELGLTDEPVSSDPAAPLVMRLNTGPLGGWTLFKFRLVATHEAGHALGFDHAPPGVPSCMEATLDLRVDQQTPYDVATAQAVYGPPTLPPLASPVTAPVTPPAATPTSLLESPTVNPTLVLVETEALSLFHNELSAGAPGDVAVKNVLAKLEAKLANPVARAIVTAILSAIVQGIEAAAAAVPAV